MHTFSCGMHNNSVTKDAWLDAACGCESPIKTGERFIVRRGLNSQKRENTLHLNSFHTPLFNDAATSMKTPVSVLKRLLWLPINILLVSMLGFFLMRYDIAVGPVSIPTPWRTERVLELVPRIELRQPIDPLAEMKQNPQISPAALESERQRLALDKPWYVQYLHWLRAFLHGDLGRNNRGESVAWLLVLAAGNTLLLNVCVIVITWGMGIPLGVAAAVRKGTPLDGTLALATALSMAMPGFVLALILGVKVVETGILPYGGLRSAQAFAMPWYAQAWDTALHLVLPVTVLSLSGIFGMQRLMRANMLDTLHREYILSAKARGLPRWRIIWKHAVRNALNPLVTLLGFEFATLFGGAVLVETVLGYPGLGMTMYQAALSGDANMVMASLVLSSMMLVLGNALADVLLRILDPRITD
jgi:peptide/nickel transport system permease protein